MMKAGESVASIFARESIAMSNSGNKISKPHEKMDPLAFLYFPMKLFHLFYSPFLSSTR